VLLWCLPYFPSQDGPARVYNLVILRDLLQGGEVWGRHFAYEPGLRPNLGFTMVGYPLLAWLSPLSAERAFVTLYILLAGISVPFFLKTFGRAVFPAALLSLPVLFNFPLMMGFYSYVLAVPIFLLCVVLGWRIRHRSFRWKFVILNTAGLLLYFCHLVPFGLFAISLVVMELADERNRGRRLAGLLMLPVTLSPALITAVNYAVASTQGMSVDFSYLRSIGRHAMLLVELLFFSTVSLSRWQLVPASLLAGFVVILGVRTVGGKFLLRRQAGGMSAEGKYCAGMIFVLLVLYLAAPFSFTGGSLFNERLPWVLLLFILPVLKMPGGARWKKWGGKLIIAFLCVSLLVNTLVLYQGSRKVSRFLVGMYSDLPRGAVVATYRHEERGRLLLADVLLHGASYYGLFRQCVDIGNIEAQFPHFQIRFRDSLLPVPAAGRLAHAPSTVEWERFPQVEYVLGWKLLQRDAAVLGRFYEHAWSEGALSLWKRR